MHDQSIQQIVDRFLSDITEAIRGNAKREAARELQEKLQEFAGGFGGKPMKGKKAKKGKKGPKRTVTPRPCPVPGCEDTARTRYQLVCKQHSEELSRKDILYHRDVAEKPGGVWYEMGIGSHAKADRRKAKAANG